MEEGGPSDELCVFMLSTQKDNTAFNYVLTVEKAACAVGLLNLTSF